MREEEVHHHLRLCGGHVGTEPLQYLLLFPFARSRVLEGPGADCGSRAPSHEGAHDGSHPLLPCWQSVKGTPTSEHGGVEQEYCRDLLRIQAGELLRGEPAK